MKPKTIPLYKDHIRRILVRSTNWIGDAVMTIPAIRAIRESFPFAEIFILAKPWVLPVFENSPHTDRLLIYDSAGKHKGLAGKLRLARELKTYHFDAAILLQNAFEAAFITFFAGIPVRIGYNTDARTLLLTHAVPCSPQIKQLHQTEYYLGILKGAGLRKPGNPDFDRSLYLRISAGQQQRADRILARYKISGNDRILGINPGATFGSAKRWGPDRYAELCQRLKPFAERILVFGSPGEEALGQHICETVGSGSVSLCGKTTLSEAIALIGRCQLFVTNDSGLMHIAAALDIPQIAIFGSTNHLTTAPAGSRSHILRIPTPCSPCLKPECPEKHHRCMKAVTVDMVCSLAEQLISTR